MVAPQSKQKADFAQISKDKKKVCRYNVGWHVGWPTKKSGPKPWPAIIGRGDRIWTYDLRVMSPASFQTAPSRDNIFYYMQLLKK